MTREQGKESIMKKWITWALAVGLLLSMNAACAESNPLVYRVTDDKGHMIYLLGTIHVGSEDMYPLGDAVEAAYRETEILAVEADVLALTRDFSQALKYSMSLMYGAGDSAKNHLSPETYALGVEYLGQPEMVLRRMRPMAWISLAEESSYARLGLNSEWGADMRLLERAHADGKRIDELEGIEFQLNVMLNMSDAMVDYQIRETLAHAEETDEALRLLVNAWREGDRNALRVLLNQEQEEVPADLEAENAAYMALLYTERDEAFEARAREYLEKGERALIAVGAAHILREGGLADRLAEAGYTVEALE